MDGFNRGDTDNPLGNALREVCGWFLDCRNQVVRVEAERDAALAREAKLREALQALYDNIAGCASINNLGVYVMNIARAALANTAPGNTP